VKLGLKLWVPLILILVSLSSIDISPVYTYGQKPPQLRPFPFDHSQNEPYLSDPNLKVEEVVGGLEAPTTMSFLGPDDFLILEKDKGTVLRVINGNVLDNRSLMLK